MRIDFRAVDLLDRMDWDDEDFPAFVRQLGKLTETVYTPGAQGRRVPMHIITVEGCSTLDSATKPAYAKGKETHSHEEGTFCADASCPARSC